MMTKASRLGEQLVHFRVRTGSSAFAENIPTPTRSRRRSQFSTCVAYKAPSLLLLPNLLLTLPTHKNVALWYRPCPLRRTLYPCRNRCRLFCLGEHRRQSRPRSGVICHSSISTDDHGRKDFPTRVCQDVPFFRSANLASNGHLHTRDNRRQPNTLRTRERDCFPCQTSHRPDAETDRTSLLDVSQVQGLPLRCTGLSHATFTVICSGAVGDV